jgi:drug/metabolite transporter (DMT)-like permease
VRASTLLYLTPPTTMLWAFLMFGDGPGPLAVPGIGLCALGVALTLGSSHNVGDEIRPRHRHRSTRNGSSAALVPSWHRS